MMIEITVICLYYNRHNIFFAFNYYKYTLHHFALAECGCPVVCVTAANLVSVSILILEDGD